MACCFKKIIQFQQGDIIAIRGNGWFSRYFALLSQYDQRYSHVGIIKIKNGKIFVIHADANELTGIGHVHENTLQEFLTDANNFGVFRLKFTASEKKKILQEAELFKIRKIPFDMKFRLDDHLSAVYCTEFIWGIILNSLKIDIVPQKSKFNHKEIISVENLLNNQWIKQID